MTFSAVDMLTVHEHLNNELTIELITQPQGNRVCPYVALQVGVSQSSAKRN